MKLFIVKSQGYYACPEFHTLQEARQFLRETVKESLARARSRFSQARKHRIAKNVYEITLGIDRRSTLWAAHWIERLL